MVHVRIGLEHAVLRKGLVIPYAILHRYDSRANCLNQSSIQRPGDQAEKVTLLLAGVDLGCRSLVQESPIGSPSSPIQGVHSTLVERAEEPLLFGPSQYRNVFVAANVAALRPIMEDGMTEGLHHATEAAHLGRVGARGVPLVGLRVWQCDDVESHWSPSSC